MHLKSVRIHADQFPTRDCYPFQLEVMQNTPEILFQSPVTLFVGENGTGKSTLLRAVALKCGIYIWHGLDRRRFNYNPYEEQLRQYLSVEWSDGVVPGSFFGSDVFHNFAQILDEWAAVDAGQLNFYGGKSLLTQSHGQSIMSFFRNRYQRKGIYFMDEPETALSPKTQIELLKMLAHIAKIGQAQFIIATHSPILMACPEAEIYSFDNIPVKEISFDQTEHYQIYKEFLCNKEFFLREI